MHRVLGGIHISTWRFLALPQTNETQKKPHKLVIELTDWSDQVFEAQYDHFEVGNEEDFYKLILPKKF